MNFEEREPANFDTVLLTAPVPQALALLDEGSVPIEAEMRRRLEGIEYTICFSLMVELDGPADLPEPGGMNLDPAEPIAFVADNTRKGLSKAPASLTVHAGPAFSQEHRDHDRDHVQELLIKHTEKYFGGANVISSQLHRWLYSFAYAGDFEDRFAVVSESPTLLLAGDAFHSPRVEGAFLSGTAAAERILTAVS